MVNGRPEEGFVNAASQITNGKLSTLTYTPTAADAGRPLTVSFQLTFPNGRTADRTIEIPMAEGVGLTGTLNVKSASVYAGQQLTLEACVISDALTPKIELPVRWELDGVPIAGQADTAVVLTGGQGLSTLTYRFASALAGDKHELACVVNPDGAEPLRLSATIKVVN